MPINKVDIYVSKILEDLSNGLTWLKRDDQGYGSIQEKYNAKDIDIAKLRLNPKLKNAETTLTIFNLIDDTDEPNTSTPESNGPANARSASTSDQVQQVFSSSTGKHSNERVPEPEPTVIYATTAADDDSLSAFADL
jgi:hypothetical protein